jgi:uncharacterized protein (DUF4415 family)
MTKITEGVDPELEALLRMRDGDIDTSDIPEVTDWTKAVVGKFYRPIKEPVTIRLDVDLVAWLKARGPGYQTRINALLRAAMSGNVRELDAVEGAEAQQVAGPQSAEAGPACLDFSFPSLEKHSDLNKWGHAARVIKERRCMFASAA